VAENFESAAHIELLNHLKEVRAEAVEHARIAQRLVRERRRIMDQLIAEGFTQADLARELGVTLYLPRKASVQVAGPLYVQARPWSGRGRRLYPSSPMTAR